MHSDTEQFPSFGQAALLLLASIVLQFLVGALLHDLRRTMGLTADQMQPLVMVLANGILLVAVMHRRRMTYRDLLHSARSSVIATLVLVVPPVLLLVPLVLLLDQALVGFVEQLPPLSAWEERAFASMSSGGLPAVVAACVLAPVLEEMFFRGVLLRAFLARYPRWAAISYSALLFGVAHLNVYQFVVAFGLGLLLGWLFERARSLWPCIALHAALNSSILALGLGQERANPAPPEAFGPITWMVALVAAAAGGIALRRLLVVRDAG